mgnify:CR=1 FL=1
MTDFYVENYEQISQSSYITNHVHLGNTPPSPTFIWAICQAGLHDGENHHHHSHNQSQN